MYRLIVTTLSTFVLVNTLSISTAVAAKKGGNGGGGEDPPVSCADAFPGFAYHRGATRKEPAGIMLASSDGCRLENIFDSPDLRSDTILLPEDDGLSGSILWSEEPGNAAQYVVKQRYFQIETDGSLTLDPVNTLLPQPGDEPNAGEQDYHFYADAWSDGSGSTAYLSVDEYRLGGAGSVLRDNWVIYQFDRNGIVDSRIVLNLTSESLSALDASANCPADAFNPHLVPACYGFAGAIWNPSGTRLYVSTDMDGWDATINVEVSNRDADGSVLPLGDWTFSSPQLVFAGPSSSPSLYSAPREINIRPGAAPGSDELTLIHYTDRTGQQTILRAYAVLNIDACIALYAPYSDGFTEPGDDNLWLQCREQGFVLDQLNRRQAWDSADSVIDTVLNGRRPNDLYRRYVSGGSAGTSEFLISNGDFVDTGL